MLWKKTCHIHNFPSLISCWTTFWWCDRASWSPGQSADVQWPFVIIMDTLHLLDSQLIFWWFFSLRFSPLYPGSKPALTLRPDKWSRFHPWNGPHDEEGHIQHPPFQREWQEVIGLSGATEAKYLAVKSCSHHTECHALCPLGKLCCCIHNDSETDLWVIQHLGLLLGCRVSEPDSLALNFWKFCEFHIIFNDFLLWPKLDSIGSIVCNWKSWLMWVGISVSYGELRSGILSYL